MTQSCSVSHSTGCSVLSRGPPSSTATSAKSRPGDTDIESRFPNDCLDCNRRRPRLLSVRGVARAARRRACSPSGIRSVLLAVPAVVCFGILEQNSLVGSLSWGFMRLRPVSGTPHEAWVNCMLRNIRIEGMAVEDGPRLAHLQGSPWRTRSRCRRPPHCGARESAALGTVHAWHLQS